jgi:hypothetical protein
MSSGIIHALLIERIGYLRRGRHDRVALVDDQLRALGVTLPIESAAVDHHAETATREKPTRRRKR